MLEIKKNRTTMKLMAGGRVDEILKDLIFSNCAVINSLARDIKAQAPEKSESKIREEIRKEIVSELAKINLEGIALQPSYKFMYKNEKEEKDETTKETDIKPEENT